MFFGTDYQIRKNFCLACNYELDGATQINGNNKPKPGGVSICINCGHLAIFGNDLALRQPTPEERE